MPRTARVVLPEHPHHVIQREHNRTSVFLEPADFMFYLDTLAEWKNALGCNRDPARLRSRRRATERDAQQRSPESLRAKCTNRCPEYSEFSEYSDYSEREKEGPTGKCRAFKVSLSLGKLMLYQASAPSSFDEKCRRTKPKRQSGWC